MILKRGLLTLAHLRMELDRRASASGVSASSLGAGGGAEGGAAAGAEESGDDGVVKKGGKKKKGKATGSGGDEAGSGAGGAGQGGEKQAEGGGGKTALAAREAVAQEDVEGGEAQLEQRSISDMAAATCQQIHELGKRVVRLQQQNLKLLEQVGQAEDLRLTADTLRRDKYLAEEELSRYASQKRPSNSPVMLERDMLILS